MHKYWSYLRNHKKTDANNKEYVSLDWREGENNYPIYDVISWKKLYIPSAIKTYMNLAILPIK